MRTAIGALAAALIVAGSAGATDLLSGHVFGDRLVVAGQAPSDAWVGVSLYPPDCEDAVREGHHQVRRAGQGRFEESYTLSRRFRDGGSYEIALWATKVYRDECTVRGCKWCAANGFHMADPLAYDTGTIGTARSMPRVPAGW